MGPLKIRPSTNTRLKGKAVPIGVVLLTRTVTLVGLIFAYYVLAFFSAVQIVPMTMGFVKAGTGVTLDMPVETVLSAWIVPALFLVGLLFAFVLFLMRGLWRLRKRAVQAVSRWALGEAPPAMGEAPPAMGAAELRPKSPRTKTSTKAA
ncbi:hypothetical protein SAMN06295974_3884 [Plantibacter flavus]|uniref:Uncharacterized protein n=1 Tax=Plantibacter flavus TaxID=150123 RepID=A0A3N2BL20_9MICO|nr:hypothetical protein [Plantibacter flavus]ROR75971.1 hypothetical protein EDD42_3922 [Plantibacter flavus]SMG49708.1 hypothetical protein SAMN06295974_3884 [Plantibacter flavus]